ncbi:hypothetical protein QYE76_063034 [Lolium multiflorum]|uniref:Uncharacterized protein n=1 Tax=Lolium multiflorum TaxID=4521 RepID=A0AAD8W8P2_LOLMU|nr:hypothetical protein QYE76_063034 [Lolium multiflorum]
MARTVLQGVIHNGMLEDGKKARGDCVRGEAKERRRQRRRSSWCSYPHALRPRPASPRNGRWTDGSWAEARERTYSLGGGETNSRQDGCDGALQQGGRALDARSDCTFLLVESAAFRMV